MSLKIDCNNGSRWESFHGSATDWYGFSNGTCFEFKTIYNSWCLDNTVGLRMTQDKDRLCCIKVLNHTRRVRPGLNSTSANCSQAHEPSETYIEKTPWRPKLKCVDKSGYFYTERLRYPLPSIHDGPRQVKFIQERTQIQSCTYRQVTGNAKSTSNYTWAYVGAALFFVMLIILFGIVVVRIHRKQKRLERRRRARNRQFEVNFNFAMRGRLGNRLGHQQPRNDNSPPDLGDHRVHVTGTIGITVPPAYEELPSSPAMSPLNTVLDNTNATMPTVSNLPTTPPREENSCEEDQRVTTLPRQGPIPSGIPPPAYDQVFDTGARVFTISENERPPPYVRHEETHMSHNHQYETLSGHLGYL